MKCNLIVGISIHLYIFSEQCSKEVQRYNKHANECVATKGSINLKFVAPSVHLTFWIMDQLWGDKKHTYN